MSSNKNSTKRFGKSNAKSDIVISWLPSLVLFVIIPFAVYLPNQIEYEYKFVVMFPFLLLAVFSFILTSLLYFVNVVWRIRAAQALFFIGLFILLSDIFSPLQWGLLDGENKIMESYSQALIELLLATVLTFCAVKLPVNITRAFGVPLVLVLFIIQPITIYQNLEEETVWSNDIKTKSHPSQTTQVMTNTPAMGNVYQIVFDAYSKLTFLDALRDLSLSDSFDGFSFFKNNLSNYNVTDASVPSYLTGTFYKTGSFKQWQLQGKKSGLISKLHHAGYNICIYSPDRSRFWTHDNASYLKTNKGLTRKYFRGYETLELAQICLVRVAPSKLRWEVFRMTDGVFGALLRAFNTKLVNKEAGLNGLRKIKRYTFYKSLSVPLMREFIRDESKRDDQGVFVYCHFMFPHGPYVWDRNGNYTGKSNFYEQTLYATKFMMEFINELKRLGRYKNSLIIFQSDHGYQKIDSNNLPDLEVPNEVIVKINSVTNYFSPEEYLKRMHSLLLVKPPCEFKKSMIVSDVPTQLVDIPSTIYDLLGLENDSLEGTSIFRLKNSGQREIHMYAGIYDKTEKGKPLILGDNILDTKLGHFSYINGKGWRIYPDIQASCK